MIRPTHVAKLQGPIFWTYKMVTERSSVEGGWSVQWILSLMPHSWIPQIWWGVPFLSCALYRKSQQPSEGGGMSKLVQPTWKSLSVALEKPGAVSYPTGSLVSGVRKRESQPTPTRSTCLQGVVESHPDLLMVIFKWLWATSEVCLYSPEVLITESCPLVS